jgi:EAL domain-containing protein (putative c-di-GMP-specific phosphodiesterase class I)
VIGAEALLRWRHPERGLIAPAAFIDALAESSIAPEVGRWIIRATCEQTAAWHGKGLMLKRVGVNLFPAQAHAKECCGTWKMRCGPPILRPTRSSSR